MTLIPSKMEALIEMLGQTDRWRPAMAKTAADFADISVTDYEQLVQFLIESGADQPLGILMCVCGVNNVRLDPQVLAEVLKIAEPMIDIAFAYREQDADAIDPLLTVIRAEDISWERQAFGAAIAAELALRKGSRQSDVKKMLMKLSQKIHTLEANLLINHSLALLDEEIQHPANMPWLTKQDVLAALPEEKPPVVIGGDYTVRRPVPKIGRNAPCPCGSGKKYKKCCHEKDQQLLRDPSPYEGITMTQLRSMPNLADDVEIIKNMRAYELKKLEPAQLNEDQLYQAYERAVHFGMRRFGYDMLMELKSRPQKQDFALGHMEDLLELALDAGDLDVAHKAMGVIPSENLHDGATIELHFDLLQNMEYFTPLEACCHQALREEEDEDRIKLDYGLLALSYKMVNIMPALSVVFARAAVMGRQRAYLDNELLVESVRSCRAELGCDPLQDPLEDFFEWTMKKGESDFQVDLKDRQIKEFKEKLIQANRSASEKQNELRKKELELERLGRKLAGAAKTPPVLDKMPESVAPLSSEQRKTAAELRRQIENLKAEINLQQHDRRQLRRKLQETQKQLRTREAKDSPTARTDKHIDDHTPQKAAKKILVPDYSPAFRRSCESLPTSMVAKALKAAADFASHENAIWRRTKPIDTLSRVYRVQIGRKYRLLLIWEPEVRLEILDLIHRRQLETWIKRYAG